MTAPDDDDDDRVERTQDGSDDGKIDEVTVAGRCGG